jgi:hypothetical protein
VCHGRPAPSDQARRNKPADHPPLELRRRRLSQEPGELRTFLFRPLEVLISQTVTFYQLRPGVSTSGGLFLHNGNYETTFKGASLTFNNPAAGWVSHPLEIAAFARRTKLLRLSLVLRETT